MVSIFSISGRAVSQRTIVLEHRLTQDQALRFKAVQQACQGRPFDTDALRQLALGRRRGEPGQMQQHQPAGLGQPQVSQTAIQLGAPATGHMGQLHSEAVFIVQGHNQLMIETNY
jgi:hypothetical protein